MCAGGDVDGNIAETKKRVDIFCNWEIVIKNRAEIGFADIRSSS